MKFVIVAIVYLSSTENNIQVIMNTVNMYDDKKICVEYIEKNIDSLSQGISNIFNNIHNIELSCTTTKKALEFKLLNDKRNLKNITYSN